MNARTSRVDGSSKSIATATATDIVRFKVMRLRRPRVKNAFDFLKLLNECEDTVFDDNNRTMTTTSKDDNRYCAYQALLKQSGVMELREDFGQVKLGERVHLCVLVQNVSSSDDEQNSAVQRREKRIATKVRVMVELLVNAPQAQNQTRQASLVLIDEISSSSSSSSSYSDNVTETMSLKPEETREIEIKFDVKRLGVHCLRCTSEYVDAPHDERSATTIMNVAGENTVYDVGVKRRTTNFFSFNVTNPLHVRTKTRRVIADSLKEKVFLEATIENVDKTDARLISKVALIVDEKRFVSTAIFPDVSDEESLFDLGDREQIYLDHDGGAAHFLFMIEERDDYVIQQRQQTSSSSLTAQALGGELNNNDKDELGTLEICWVGASGEPGRLQTQPILAPKPSDSTPPPPIVNLLERSISTSSSSINKAASQRPILKLTIEIINDEDDLEREKIRKILTETLPEKITFVTAEKPFQVRVTVSNVSSTTDSGLLELRIEDDSGAILVNGDSVATLEEISKENGSASAVFEMVAIAPGVKKLPRITVREPNARILLAPAAREIFVLAPSR